MLKFSFIEFIAYYIGLKFGKQEMNFGSKLTKVNESTRLESTGPKKLIIDYLHSLERKKSIKMKEKIKLSR